MIDALFFIIRNLAIEKNKIKESNQILNSCIGVSVELLSGVCEGMGNVSIKEICELETLLDTKLIFFPTKKELRKMKLEKLKKLKNVS